MGGRAVLVLVMVAAAAAAQTFQYSRGWTNGKRGGPPAGPPAGPAAELALLTPCQLARLRALLEGKPLSDRWGAACESAAAAADRREGRRAPPDEPLYDALQ